MRQVLERYIFLEKTEVLRANKIKAMQALLTAFEAEKQLSLSEINGLVQAVNVRQPVFEKLIYPVLEEGVEVGNIEAIKTMISLMQHVYIYQSRRKEWKYDAADLISAGLHINPTDGELLNWKYDAAVRYLRYTIHEIPAGVLWDANSANESQCQELLDYTSEVEQLSRSLSKDDVDLIADCRYYYRSYGAYLAARGSYHNFAAYLAQHPR